jgi:hypothetical protein
MRYFFYVFAIFVLLVLPACKVAEYKKADPDAKYAVGGFGYYDRLLGRDIYLLEYYGAQIDDVAQLKQLYHRRAKELCPTGYTTKIDILRKVEARFSEHLCFTNGCANNQVISGIVRCKSLNDDQNESKIQKRKGI